MKTLRLTFLRAGECPGPPLHDCTDRTHPIMVQVMPLSLLAEGITISNLPAGIARLTLDVVGE